MLLLWSKSEKQNKELAIGDWLLANCNFLNSQSQITNRQ
jgi:hypothetical protein